MSRLPEVVIVSTHVATSAPVPDSVVEEPEPQLIAVPSSLKLTVPAALGGDTVAVKVTVWPSREGVWEAASDVDESVTDAEVVWYSVADEAARPALPP
jgi:hypothetical protein